jgi:hypothetical protein
VTARRGLAAALWLACARVQAAEPNQPPVERKVEKMERIGDEALRGALEPGNALALVRVIAVKLHAAGSRSEHVTVELQVERALCGSPPERVQAWSFTSKGDKLVAESHRYVMVLLAAQGYAPFGIGDRVEVPPGQEAEAVAQHEKALASLGAAKP